jgi:hypothetical protein
MSTTNSQNSIPAAESALGSFGSVTGMAAGLGGKLVDSLTTQEQKASLVQEASALGEHSGVFNAAMKLGELTDKVSGAISGVASEAISKVHHAGEAVGKAIQEARDVVSKHGEESGLFPSIAKAEAAIHHAGESVGKAVHEARGIVSKHGEEPGLFPAIAKLEAKAHHAGESVAQPLHEAQGIARKHGEESGLFPAIEKLEAKAHQAGKSVGKALQEVGADISHAGESVGKGFAADASRLSAVLASELKDAGHAPQR